jgi:hypothetical protein
MNIYPFEEVINQQINTFEIFFATDPEYRDRSKWYILIHEMDFYDIANEINLARDISFSMPRGDGLTQLEYKGIKVVRTVGFEALKDNPKLVINFQ